MVSNDVRFNSSSKNDESIHHFCSTFLMREFPDNPTLQNTLNSPNPAELSDLKIGRDLSRQFQSIVLTNRSLKLESYKTKTAGIQLYISRLGHIHLRKERISESHREITKQEAYLNSSLLTKEVVALQKNLKLFYFFQK